MPTSPLPWEREGWRESVAPWISESLRESGIEATGPVEHLRQRPWAAVALVPTEEGSVYFKADPPSESFEPALTQWLARRRPELIPSVIRIDRERGWLLTHDAGAPLREHLADPPDPAIWDELLPLCAELEIELCDSVQDLLALDVPDKRPENLPSGYGDLLSQWPATAAAPSQQQIEALVEGIGAAIPPSLAHEEFQDNNILLRDRNPVLIDWAEAAIEHPFCGLVNTFRGLVARWGFEPGSAELLRLRDVYLEPWTRFAPLPRLIELFELAYPLGMLCRALTWDRLLTKPTKSERAEYADFIPAWLQMASDTLEGKATLGT